MNPTRSVVQLGGRLGNLLFQIAFGVDLRRRTGQPVAYYGNLDASLRSELEAWSGPLDWAEGDEVHGLTGGPTLRGKLDRRVRSWLPVRYRRHILQRRNFAETWHFRVRRPAYWSGYWQSLAYWTGSEAQLREALHLRVPFPTALQEAADLARRPGSCSVHVRRGDYVGNLTFPTLDQDFHRRAVSAVDPQGPVLVFSDDPAWCRTELDLGRDFRVVEGGSPAQDLGLMAECQHHVVANSTFSWWGARLAVRPGKTVAPARWFASFGREPRRNELYPASWSVLQHET